MESQNDQSEFQKQVGAKERRKLKARLQPRQSIWKGFGVFGLVGWSVAVPTVIFVLIGMWLDEQSNSTRSYTLTFLIAGLCLGCFNAWYWVDKKLKEIQEDEPLNEEENE